MLNNVKDICAKLELCAHELYEAINGENAQDAGYLRGCIIVQVGRMRECIANLSVNKGKKKKTKIITDIRLFAIGDQWGAEVEYPDGSTEPIWAVNGNEGPPDWDKDDKSYEEWYNRSLEEAHKQGFILEGELANLGRICFN